jgi:hypothetical protein
MTLFATAEQTEGSLMALLPTFATSLNTAPQQIPQSHTNPKVVGKNMTEQTVMTEVCDQSCTLWILGHGAKTAITLIQQLGICPLIIYTTEEEEFWQEECDALNVYSHC